MLGPDSQVPDLGNDVVLAPDHPLEPLAVQPVDVVLGGGDPSALEVDPSQPLEVLAAQFSLHRQPDPLVDLLGTGRQQHEEVVAQQIGLGEPHPRRIQ